ncbi:hypothetical protein RIVM261_064640 [Rivularia sp. IAM M-261]|nr:hypothetical protein CAL7716_051110 [Calothrix sp. PCC 7716]GJD21508.1 hypothetical protein RIVM261_064640 [Rivularia sp. IAM M-261]
MPIFNRVIEKFKHYESKLFIDGAFRVNCTILLNMPLRLDAYPQSKPKYGMYYQD